MYEKRLDAFVTCCIVESDSHNIGKRLQPQTFNNVGGLRNNVNMTNLAFSATRFVTYFFLYFLFSSVVV